MIQKICICGAGTMGSGIAQVAAHSGFETILFDVDAFTLVKAKESIQKNLEYLITKEKLSAEEKENIFRSIYFTNNKNECLADLIIEAIIEKPEAKVSLFNQLTEINTDETILASNTSSLSISEIQNEIPYPERVVGMHFFNPATLMKLVEIVKGDKTNEEVTQSVFDLCKRFGKIPVMCKDAPGFIVNRIARHYYLEAMKLAEEGIASFEDIDEVMEFSGFKMGPFKLMDLIGIDINLSVSESVYKAYNNARRFKPSQMQIDKVSKNELGRKTGKGFYTYNS